MPDQTNDELVKVIIWVAIAVVYGIVAVARKANKWIEQHRVPPTRTEDGSYPQARPTPPPVRREAPTSLPELVETLMGERREPQERREARPAAPAPAVRKAYSYPQQPKPKAAMAPKPAPRPVIPLMAVFQPVSRVTATVQHRTFGHLRVLGSKADLRRAVLLHEILSPPVAMRRRAATLPFFAHRRA